MKIAQKYEGDRYIAVIYNGIRYMFISRGDSDFLTKEIPLYTRGKDSKVLSRYEGVNDEAFFLIIRTINKLNEGKKVDLEKLLEDEC